MSSLVAAWMQGLTVQLKTLTTDFSFTTVNSDDVLCIKDWHELHMKYCFQEFIYC
jgi:hypothetical protein